MKLRIWYSIVIFFGSYFPLALILLVQDVKYDMLSRGLCSGFWKRDVSCEIPLMHPALSVGMLVATLCCFCLTLVALHVFRPKLPIKVIETKYIPAELMSYALPYVVAFMSVGYGETGKFLGVTIFLIWMFWITHRAGQILLNPLLAAFGWRLYEIKYAFATDTVLRNGRALVHGLIEPEQRYAHTVVQDIVILKSSPNGNERQ